MLHEYALQILHQRGGDDDGPIFRVLGNGWILLVQSDNPGLEVLAPLCLLRFVVLLLHEYLQHPKSVLTRETVEKAWFLALAAVLEVKERIVNEVVG